MLKWTCFNNKNKKNKKKVSAYDLIGWGCKSLAVIYVLTVIFKKCF